MPGLEQFFSLVVPILFLSSFYPSPRHKNPPISEERGRKKDIPWSPVSHLNLLGDISSRTGRGIRMPCHPWKQHCTCSLVRTLVCCVDVVSPLYPPQLIELKDSKWTLTKDSFHIIYNKYPLQQSRDSL